MKRGWYDDFSKDTVMDQDVLTEWANWQDIMAQSTGHMQAQPAERPAARNSQVSRCDAAHLRSLEPVALALPWVGWKLHGPATLFKKLLPLYCSAVYPPSRHCLQERL